MQHVDEKHIENTIRQIRGEERVKIAEVKLNFNGSSKGNTL